MKIAWISVPFRGLGASLPAKSAVLHLTRPNLLRDPQWIPTWGRTGHPIVSWATHLREATVCEVDIADIIADYPIVYLVTEESGLPRYFFVSEETARSVAQTLPNSTVWVTEVRK